MVRVNIRVLSRKLQASGAKVYTDKTCKWDWDEAKTALGACGVIINRHLTHHYVIYETTRIGLYSQLLVLIHEAGHWFGALHYTKTPNYDKYCDRFTTEKAERHAYVWGWKLIEEMGWEESIPRKVWVKECYRAYTARKFINALKALKPKPPSRFDAAADFFGFIGSFGMYMLGLELVTNDHPGGQGFGVGLILVGVFLTYRNGTRAVSNIVDLLAAWATKRSTKKTSGC